MSVYKVIVYNPFNFKEKIWESNYEINLKTIHNKFKETYPDSIITYSIIKNIKLNRNIRDGQYIKILQKSSDKFSNVKLNELQQLCKDYHVRSCGKKYEVCKRLENVEKYKDLTDNRLRQLCEENLLSNNGTRILLLNRLLKNEHLRIINERELSLKITNKTILFVYAKWCKKSKKQYAIYRKNIQKNYYIMNIDDLTSETYINDSDETPIYLLFNNNNLIKKGKNLRDILN